MLRFLGILTLSFLFVSVASAQTEQGAITIDLGTGLGIYGAKTNDPDANAEADTVGVNAAAGLVNFTATYSIIDDLSVGASFERNGFVVGSDSASENESGQSLNYRFVTQYRLVNSEKNCLFLQGGIGYSSFKFEDGPDDTVEGDGLTYDFSLGYQHYFGETAGFFLQAGWTGYKYNELIDENGTTWLVGGTNDPYELTLQGVNIRLGLALRF